MDLRRLSFAPVLGAAVLTGCVTAPPAPSAPDVARGAAVTAPNPAAPLPATDPLVRLHAFVASQGLSSTPAKPGEASRLAAAWNNKVIYAPDPTHGGDPVPGLLARVWVFGPDEATPLETDGELIVGVWDNSPKATGGQPVLQEVWHIDAETAKKFRRPDMFGSGYTLFLPWSKYHVDLKQVNVVARFNGADGRSLVSTPEIITLDHSATLQRAAERLAGLSNGGPATAKLPTTELPAPLPLNFPEAPRK